MVERTHPKALAAPRAVLFDAYGTLFDVYSVGQCAEACFPSQGTALAALWREKQIDYTRLCSMSGRYQPFSQLTRAGLRHAALRLGLALDREKEERLMAAYQTLSLFPENSGVLQALRARGIPTGILSNGDPEMLEGAVQNAGLAPWLNHVLSVHGVQRYKTDPAAYALGPQALGLAAGEILFVSSNAWDALGATWFGYQTLWVNRSGAPPETIGPPPSHAGSNLSTVLDCFALWP